MKNTQIICNNTALFERAKKDYATGLYAWFDLKPKYNLNIKQVFEVVFAVRKEREQK